MTRLLDILARAYLAAFVTAAVVGLDLLPSPFGVLVCAGLGAIAIAWICR